MAIRVVVADGDPIVRFGLAAFFQNTNIEVVQEVATCQEAVLSVNKRKPDVLLIEARLPDAEGFDVLPRLKSTKTSVLFFSGFDNPTYLARAKVHGAKGYVSKRASREELINAVRTAAQGDSSWSLLQLRQISGGLQLDSEQHPNLTVREREVLHQLALGLSNIEIAKALSISVETVKEHVQHVLEKLGVTRRTQAAVWAIRETSGK